MPPRSVGVTSWTWLKTCLDATALQRATYVQTLLSRVGNHQLVEIVHKYLYEQTLPVRDAWWTTALATWDGREVREMMCSWPLSECRSGLTPEIALAYTSALAWLTTCTDVILRAEATKAITGVLDCAPAIVPALLARFQRVNDPYILQSVTLATYGACLRCGDPLEVKRAAEHVLKLWPTKERWPVDLLARHALCGIVEIASVRNPSWHVNLDSVRPPYKSRWVSKALTWAEINRRVSRDNKKRMFGFSRIVSSCTPEYLPSGQGMHYGDFGRYVVGSACSHFHSSSSHAESRASRRAFPVDLPHRFIIKRVLELGWTPARFNEFDDNHTHYDRHKTRHERIGKKYQWVSLCEFLARAADRCPLFEHWPPEPVKYEHPRQVSHEFHVDTSILRVRPKTDPNNVSASWWDVQHGGRLWGDHTDQEWLLCDAGVPNPRSYVIQSQIESGKRWAMLWGYLSWTEKQPGVFNSHGDLSRRVFLHVRCFALKRENLKQFTSWMSVNRADDLPNAQQLCDSMFGELYWSRSAKLETELDDRQSPWIAASEMRQELPCPVIPLAADYLNESDATFDFALSGLIPCRWLVESLNLRSGTEGLSFVDGNGDQVTWNPAVISGGSDAALIDLDRLAVALEERDLVPVWCVTGEKNSLGDRQAAQGPRWPWIQGCYWLKNGELAGSHRIEFDEDFRAGRPRVFPPRVTPAALRNPDLADLLSDDLEVGGRTTVKKPKKDAGTGKRRSQSRKTRA